VQKRPWRPVHRIFYTASRCGGVEEIKAKVINSSVVGRYDFKATVFV
jgi:hypothetical protein